MSTSVISQNAFLSATQPKTSVSTYAVPSEFQNGDGGLLSKEAAQVKRVHQQIQMRLSERPSTLPKMNCTVSQYATSEHRGYSTCSPGFSSKSSLYTMGRRIAAPQASNFSSRSAIEIGPHTVISYGSGIGAGGGSQYHNTGGFQNSHRKVVSSSWNRDEPDTASLSSVHLKNPPQQALRGSVWMNRGSREGSVLSERDATLPRFSNGFESPATPGSVFTPVTGIFAGASGGQEQIFQGASFKGPSQRKINRDSRIIPGVSSMQYQQVSTLGSSQNAMQQWGSTLPRGTSALSTRSVGKGMDVFDGQVDVTGSTGNISSLDMATAVQYLMSTNPKLQALGAAVIQHECFHKNEAKDQLRNLKGIHALVQLFNSEHQEVQRYASGAARNAVFENMENKAALIEAGGIQQITEALGESDDEIRKNVTGILWNLSSKSSLKEKLAKETLDDLTDKILVPLSGSIDNAVIQHNPSEVEIFCNTTGCLRNLSSMNEKTRQQMKETQGLVDALVSYIQGSLQDSKVEDKGVENAICILRNLAYQLYSEMPSSILQRLDGPVQENKKSEAIGCFGLKSKKAKDMLNQDLSTFTEVAKQPKGQEWLWHPQVVGVYNHVLQQCKNNVTTRESAAGALQNITAGDKRWAAVLCRVALEQERMLPVILDQLRTSSDQELRSLTGLLRNLSRNAKTKSDIVSKVVPSLVAKLPSDGRQKEPSSDVVVNICGALNHLVAAGPEAAREITSCEGLSKLMAIKNSHSNSPGNLKAAQASAMLLSNMFQYNKLHKDYSQKGFTRVDFVDSTI